MPPEEDARAILRLALRHEQSLAASLDPGFAQGTGGFLAQQCVENLLKGLIVLADQQPPLSHDLARLQLLAGARLPEELLELQEFAVKGLLLARRNAAASEQGAAARPHPPAAQRPGGTAGCSGLNFSCRPGSPTAPTRRRTAIRTGASGPRKCCRSARGPGCG
jgi:HEPN domain-containing protein